MMKKVPLIECHWEITNACNLACIHCIANSGQKRSKELTTGKVKRAVDILESLGCRIIKFTGGEPLVRKDFFQIASYCHKKGVILELLSNATLINQKKAQRLKPLVKKVGVSIDGSNSRINDQIRGLGSFEKILNGIENLRKQKIPITLFVTLTKINIQDITNVLNLAKKLEIPEVRINDLSLSGRALTNEKVLFWNLRDKRASLIRIFIEFYECNKDKLAVDDNCEVNMTSIFLSSEGFIYPCIEVFQRTPENHLGNILNYTPKQFIGDKERLLKEARDKKCCYEFIYGSGFRICINKQAKCVLAK